MAVVFLARLMEGAGFAIIDVTSYGVAAREMDDDRYVTFSKLNSAFAGVGKGMAMVFGG